MTTELSPAAMKELLRHSVDVITVLDDSGVIQYGSPSIRRMLGYDPAECIGDNVFEYVHPEDRQMALDTFHALLESSTGESTDAIEVRFRHKDGKWVWAETRGSTEKGSEIGGYVVTSRDITKRKEYERDLTRERDRLERFVSVISHDLRNPLNVAQGYVEVAQEACESDHLDAISRAHARMEALIEDLSTLAREGEMDPQVDAVDLRKMGEACWETVETNAATLSIQTGQTILADERQCRQLLENLFRNAVEHGGDAVTITIGELSDGFYVADDGRGLPDEASETLLEDGFSTKTDGTGLGLSIVREVVENHAWTLTVRDGADGGARFDIRNVTFV